MKASSFSAGHLAPSERETGFWSTQKKDGERVTGVNSWGLMTLKCAVCAQESVRPWASCFWSICIMEIWGRVGTSGLTSKWPLFPPLGLGVSYLCSVLCHSSLVA